eukprot:scpid2142/ scgid2245/ 
MSSVQQQQHGVDKEPGGSHAHLATNVPANTPMEDDEEDNAVEWMATAEAVHTVFLPRCLPDQREEDTNPLFLHYGHRSVLRKFASITKDILPARIHRMLNAWNDTYSPNPVNLYVTWKQMVPADTFPIYLPAQNAALTFTLLEGNLVNVSAYDIQTEAQTVVNAKGALLTEQPRLCVVIPTEQAFSHTMADQICCLQQYVFPDAAATGSESDNCEAVSPKYVFEWLFSAFAVLQRPGTSSTTSRVQKKVRDVVTGAGPRDSSSIPWRRHPAWFALKFILHVTLVNEKGHRLGSIIYKMAMLRFMAEFVKCGSGAYHDDADVLQQMLAKLSKRIHKLSLLLESSSSVPKILATRCRKVMHSATLVVEQASERQLTRWHAFSDAVQDTSQLPGLPAQHDDADSTTLPLDVSGDRISGMLGATSGEPASIQQGPMEKHADGGFPLTNGSRESRLIGLHTWEENMLLRWKARTSQPMACHSALELMEAYESATSHFNVQGNALEQSRRLLVAFVLMAMCDISATEEFPLLLKHSTDVDPSPLQHILATTPLELEVLHGVETYFKSRNNAGKMDGPLQARVMNESLSVKFCEGHGDMMRTRDRLLQEDKAREMQHVASVERQLKNMIKSEESFRKLDHTYTVVSHVHLPTCRKCELDRELDKREHDIFEREMPPTEACQKAIAFEVCIPGAVKKWRDCLLKFNKAFLLSVAFNGTESRTKVRWLNRVDDRWPVGPIILASTNKSFTHSQYRSLKLRNRWSSDDFVEACILNCTLADDTHRCALPAPRAQNDKVQQLCTISHGNGSLQSFIKSTGHQQSNVIAQQNICPDFFSVREFVTFGSIRAGKQLQWFNILRGIHQKTLLLHRSEVVQLIAQSIWQAETNEDNRPLRDTHHPCGDAAFVREFSCELQSVLNGVRGNWANYWSLCSVIVLANRLLSLHSQLGPAAPAEDTIERLHEVLADCRKVAVEWLDKIRSLLEEIKDESAGKLQSMSVHIAAFGALSYRHSVHLEQHDNTPLFHWLKFVTDLHRNTVAHQALGFLEILIAQVLRTARSNHSTTVQLFNGGIHNGINVEYDTFVTEFYAPGNVVSGYDIHQDNQLWINCKWQSVNGHTEYIQLDLRQGKCWINGLAPGRLSSDITNTKLFARHFRSTVFVVSPCTSPQGQVAQTTSAMTGAVSSEDVANEESSPAMESTEERVGPFVFASHDRSGNGQLCIYECRGDGRKLLLLDPSWFSDRSNFDLPALLVKEHSFWLDLESHEVFLRPVYFRDKDFARLDRCEYVLDFGKRQMMVLNAAITGIPPGSTMLSSKSPLGASILEIMARIELAQYVELWRDTGGTVHIRLSRLGLSFFVSPEEKDSGLLRSGDYTGWCVDSDQSLGTLIALSSGLVLVHHKGEVCEQRCLLVPHGTPEFAQGGSCVKINLTDLREPPVFRVNIQPNLRQLQAPDSRSAWIYLALLHGTTSSVHPDPFTGMTGMEMAMTVLQSARCWSASPLDHTSMYWLYKVACLSPRRTSNRSGTMQLVDWPSYVPSYCASDAFILLVDRIIANSQSMVFLYKGSQFQEGQTHADKISRHSERSLSTVFYHWSHDDLPLLARPLAANAPAPVDPQDIPFAHEPSQVSMRTAWRLLAEPDMEDETTRGSSRAPKHELTMETPYKLVPGRQSDGTAVSPFFAATVPSACNAVPPPCTSLPPSWNTGVSSSFTAVSPSITVNSVESELLKFSLSDEQRREEKTFSPKLASGSLRDCKDWAGIELVRDFMALHQHVEECNEKDRLRLALMFSLWSYQREQSSLLLELLILLTNSAVVSFPGLRVFPAPHRHVLPQASKFTDMIISLEPYIEAHGLQEPGMFAESAKKKKYKEQVEELQSKYETKRKVFTDAINQDLIRGHTLLQYGPYPGTYSELSPARLPMVFQFTSKEPLFDHVPGYQESFHIALTTANSSQILYQYAKCIVDAVKQQVRTGQLPLPGFLLTSPLPACPRNEFNCRQLVIATPEKREELETMQRQTYTQPHADNSASSASIPRLTRLTSRKFDDLELLEEKLKGMQSRAPESHRQILDEFSADLHESLDDLRSAQPDHNVSTTFQSPLDEVTCIGFHGREQERCWDIQSRLETAINRCVSRSPSLQALHSCGLLLRPVPLALFPELLSRTAPASGLVDIRISDDVRELIGALCVAMVNIRRYSRMSRLFKDGPEDWLQREISNAPHATWTPCDHPEWLLFELENDLCIRQRQVDVAKQMMCVGSASAKRKHAVMQLNMGEGKTSVILPIIAAELADSHALVRVIVLTSLHNTNFNQLVFKLGGLLNHRVYAMPFRRDIPIGKNEVRRLHGFLQGAKQRRDVMVTMREHLLSLQIKHQEACFKAQTGLARSLGKVMASLQYCARDVIDEADEVLNYRFQLIYPLGDPSSPDGKELRWDTAELVLDAVKVCIPEVKRAFEKTIAYTGNTAHAFPFVRIHDSVEETEAYRMLCALVSDYIFAGQSHLTKSEFMEGMRHTTPAQREFLKRFIQVEDLSAADVEAFSYIPENIRNTLLLLRGLLATGVLRLALKKRYRVEYGLLSTTHQSSVSSRVGRVIKMAVPFRAKDVAAERTEFGHVDVAVMLTLLSYYQHGLTADQMDIVLAKLLRKEAKNEIYNSWVEQAGRESVDESIRHLSSINRKDPLQMKDLVYPFLCHHTDAINFFVNSTIFPSEAKEFPRKLVANGWSMTSTRREMIVTGFSGTNDTRHLLPGSTEQQDLPQLKHTNAYVCSLILKTVNNQYHVLPDEVNGQELVNRLVLHGSTCGENISNLINTIIDAGATILDLSNADVAKCWLQKRPDKQGVVYFDHANQLRVHDRRSHKPRKLELSAFASNLEECLVYLDHAHCRGTDLQMVDGTVAAVTLGKKLRRDEFVQACMRMRRLNSTHSISFWAPPEIDRQIRQLCRLEAGTCVEHKHVLLWCIMNSITATEDGFYSWASQGLVHLQIDNALKQLQSNEDLDSVICKTGQQCTLPDGMQLCDMYGQARFPQPVGTIISQTAKTVMGTDEIVKRCNALVPNVYRYAQELDEEQEREMEQEIEVERQREMPRSKSPVGEVLPEYLKTMAQQGLSVQQLPSHIKATGLVRIWRCFEDTSLSRTTFHPFLAGPLWHCSENLFATSSFRKTVAQDSRVLSYADAYLRPVEWLLLIRQPSHSTVILISPFQANELCRLHRRTPANWSPSSSLLMYASPGYKMQTIMSDWSCTLAGESLSPLPCLPNRLQKIFAEILCFAGGLFFGRDRDEMLMNMSAIAHIFSLAPAPVSGSMETVSYVEKPFTSTQHASPGHSLKFLRHVLDALRSADSLEHSEMGSLLLRRAWTPHTDSGAHTGHHLSGSGEPSARRSIRQSDT